MPHLVIEGALSAERVHRELALFEERRGGTVYKLREAFLARSGKSALLEAVVVEGVTRRFLVEVVDQPGAVTVRLFPLTDPEKTEGVKRLLARVGVGVRALDPGARIGRTNLAAQIAELQA